MGSIHVCIRPYSCVLSNTERSFFLFLTIRYISKFELYLRFNFHLRTYRSFISNSPTKSNQRRAAFTNDWSKIKCTFLAYSFSLSHFIHISVNILLYLYSMNIYLHFSKHLLCPTNNEAETICMFLLVLLHVLEVGGILLDFI